MKKAFATSGLIACLALSSAAMATPITTWTDNVANGFTLNNGHPDYSFIYNLTGSGSALNVLTDPSNLFHPGTDLITSADLLLNFTFNGVTTKTANINLDSTTQSLLNFTIKDQDLNLDAGGVAQLNVDGSLRLDIHQINGTYELTDSVFTAYGTDNTLSADPPSPVPEPGTLMLMGAGFLGLAIYGKRRKQA